MRVTIEVSDRVSAVEMLKATSYMEFINDFWGWMEGAGRENLPNAVKDKFIELAQVHHISAA